MKYQYKEMPESMKGTYGEFSKNFGFDWKEFIMGLNKSILTIFDDMENPIPKWYCRDIGNDRGCYR